LFASSLPLKKSCRSPIWRDKLSVEMRAYGGGHECFADRYSFRSASPICTHFNGQLIAPDWTPTCRRNTRVLRIGCIEHPILKQMQRHTERGKAELSIHGCSMQPILKTRVFRRPLLFSLRLPHMHAFQRTTCDKLSVEMRAYGGGGAKRVTVGETLVF
jgi:hypothetical protein